MLKKILNHFKAENQKLKLLEELDELIQAIYNYLQVPSVENFKAMLYELVDVTILIIQMGIIEGFRPLTTWAMFFKEYIYKIFRTVKILKECERTGKEYDEIRYKAAE